MKNDPNLQILRDYIAGQERQYDTPRVTLARRTGLTPAKITRLMSGGAVRPELAAAALLKLGLAPIPPQTAPEAPTAQPAQIARGGK